MIQRLHLFSSALSFAPSNQPGKSRLSLIGEAGEKQYMVTSTGIKKILIFDDDADFRNLLMAFLQKSFEGVELEEYDPVARGIPDEGFDWSQYDVLLLDYYLCVQGVTGLDILQANRKNQFFPATIMLTGAGNEEVAVRALKAGVHDYIRKEKLDKAKLRNSILDAFENHKVERERINELTNQSLAFNKALFYQNLELKHDDPEYVRRVLLLIRLDNHKTIEQKAGLIVRDNIVRHLAKQCFEIFRLGECNPNITRLSDISVALLIDDPASEKTLEFNLDGLCTHLRKHPYKFEGKKYRFSVSIGVVHLAGDGKKAEKLIELAKSACAIAAKEEGNSFHFERGEAVVPPRATRETPVSTSSQSEIPAKPAPAPPPPPSATEKPKSATEEKPVEEAGAEPRPDKIKPKLIREQTSANEPKSDVVPETVPEKPKHSAPPTTPPPTPPGKTTPKPAVKDNTVQEKKAEQKQPKVPHVPAGEPAPAAEKPASDEIELIESELSEEELKLKKAFEEKRVMKTFQPIISLTEISNDSELQYVSLEMVDTDGTITNISDIQKATRTPLFQEYIDRWMLRETIGRLIDHDYDKYLFIIRISAVSLADATLFNWLRKLLSGLDAHTPGKYIAFEITAEDFMAVEKQAAALITYLRKTHGFKFILSEIKESDDIKTLYSKAKFDLFKMKHEVITKLNETPDDDAPDNGSILDLLKSKGANIIADNVEDATTLTTAITLGIDFAMGFFIGEPTVQLDETTNIESFEII